MYWTGCAIWGKSLLCAVEPYCTYRIVNTGTYLGPWFLAWYLLVSSRWTVIFIACGEWEGEKAHQGKMLEVAAHWMISRLTSRRYSIASSHSTYWQITPNYWHCSTRKCLSPTSQELDGLPLILQTVRYFHCFQSEPSGPNCLIA